MTAALAELVRTSERMKVVAEEKKVDELNKETCDCEQQQEPACECAAEESCCCNEEAGCCEDACAEADTEEAEGTEASEAETGKKGFFGKKKDKKEEAYKAQIAELNDKVMRQMAEFENFRKRTEKEKTAMFETGAKSVIEKILPVVDNFERGLAMVSEDKKEDPVYDGMNKIYKQLMTELEKIGVTAIPEVGEEFNPDLHNAVMQVENDELESGTVAQELQKGYKYHDSVVRYSMVAVVS